MLNFRPFFNCAFSHHYLFNPDSVSIAETIRVLWSIRPAHISSSGEAHG